MPNREATRPSIPGPWLTQEVAQYYRYTPRWVESQVARGMPVHRLGGHLRFRTRPTRR